MIKKEIISKIIMDNVRSEKLGFLQECLIFSTSFILFLGKTSVTFI